MNSQAQEKKWNLLQIKTEIESQLLLLDLRVLKNQKNIRNIKEEILWIQEKTRKKNINILNHLERENIGEIQDQEVDQKIENIGKEKALEIDLYHNN